MILIDLDFLNRILHCNADRLLHKSFHLSLSEIDSEFKSFCISNSSCSIVQMVPVVNVNRDNSNTNVRIISNIEKPKKFQIAAPGSTFIPIKNICMPFNSTNGCNNKFDQNTMV